MSEGHVEYFGDGSMRQMLGRAHGSTEREVLQASALASYLLFDGCFTGELIALGRADAMRQCEAIHALFGWGQSSLPPSSYSTARQV